jgi:hypothetical protein
MKVFVLRIRHGRSMEICAISTLLANFAVIGQTLPTRSTAANGWMSVATDVSSPDIVPPMVRLTRDSYADGSPLASKEPLTPENAALHQVFPGRVSTRDPEIRQVPNRAVFIAAFSEYRSILTASGREIYTEVKFRTGKVFQDEVGHATPQSDITALVRGGTVKTKDGKTISYLTSPRAFSVQPHHTYLLVLSYYADGDFYKIDRSWDISDGVVRVNSEVEQKRVQEGKSTLVGLTTDQLIRSLEERFVAR